MKCESIVEVIEAKRFFKKSIFKMRRWLRENYPAARIESSGNDGIRLFDDANLDVFDLHDGIWVVIRHFGSPSSSIETMSDEFIRKKFRPIEWGGEE